MAEGKIFKIFKNLHGKIFIQEILGNISDKKFIRLEILGNFV